MKRGVIPTRGPLRIFRSSGLAFSLVLFSVACEPEPQIPPIATAEAGSQPLAACYRLHFGKWSPALDPETERRLPQVVRLSNSVLFAGPEDTSYRLDGAVTAAGPWERRGEWEHAGIDSIAIGIGSWSWGVRLLLPDTGATVRGSARQYWDVVVPIMPEAAVRAERVTCAPDFQTQPWQPPRRDTSREAAVSEIDSTAA